MIAIISNNESFLEHIKPLEEEYTVFCDEAELIEEYEVLIVEDKNIALEKIFTKYKTLVLSELPEFHEAMNLLNQGSRGYGNTYMSLVHLTQAISTIKNDVIWLQPTIMSSLIVHGSQVSKNKEPECIECLSMREKEVALEIQEGKTNKEIAISLGITQRTVKAHLSHIFEKLEVHDRLSLAIFLRA
ncbi:response regulator transcription factor [Sulfurimonas sp.]|jgi:DNA-binding NarL/FixJ family response regulator|uniref:response regulator transcription factor n=1 Tax=Sulfurimonas sp. TaxID=2022749 RepID=UPI0025D70FA1|nr:response regulator transcription factor [Sulfurimonas sp.]MBT5935333.1 response regulator transcription factor [Sulfurimonas sp.]